MLTDFEALAAELARVTNQRRVGRVTAVGTAALEIAGLSNHARIGDQVAIGLGQGQALGGEIVGISESLARAMTYAPLDGAAVKLTAAYYDAPAGRRIEGQGIMPDLVVGQSAGNEAADLDAARPAALQTHASDATIGDRQLDRALRFLQDDAIVARH